MSFHLTQTMDILARTPKTLDALLRDVGAEWHAIDEGPDTWSALEVLGHLVHGEDTDWIPRARIILEHGDSRTFDPFDRWAQRRRFSDWSVNRLLDRFTELRQTNLQTLTAWQLTEEQLALPGRHPELGAVTLKQLLATWAVHDLGHIAQISRVMAKRYRSEVGPWEQYIPILSR